MSPPAIETHVFDAPSHLKIVAKRYTMASSTNDGRGLTLLFTHCIGARTCFSSFSTFLMKERVVDKEQWEPVIQHLFKSQSSKDNGYRIREAWSFDWQNHGDAAILNREVLKFRPEGVCECY